MKFDTSWRIVLWGHKSLQHNTFAYVFYGFERAARHLGFKTAWVDHNDDPGYLGHSIFITEGQVDHKIPMDADCYYVLHNVCGPENRKKYEFVYGRKQVLDIQTYTNDAEKYGDKISECILFNKEGRSLFSPWATDLLPHEIDANKPTRVFNEESKVVNWVGTVGEGTFGNVNELRPFSEACAENGINFEMSGLWGGSRPKDAGGPGAPSPEENVQLIKDSYMAPTLVGTWQKEKGYVPCRIFKNISYGQPGLTNSPAVKRMFGEHTLLNTDEHQLFYQARDAFKSMSLEQLHAAMDFVRDHHTYVNRLTTILESLERIQD